MNVKIWSIFTRAAGGKKSFHIRTFQGIRCGTDFTAEVHYRKPDAAPRCCGEADLEYAADTRGKRKAEILL